MSVDLSGLMAFERTLKRVRTNTKVSKENPEIKRVIDISLNELKRAYAGKNVSIYVEENEDGFTVFVKDKNTKNPKIAFDEFGTGYYAKGSYPGELPTQKITFVSAKYKQKTDGWEYYYDWQGPKNRNPKKTHGGIKGWVTKDGTFHIGNNANATMYKACKRIIAKIRSGENV